MTKLGNKKFKDRVCRLVKTVPKGRVTTYGSIAGALGQQNWARQVGWVLHQNNDPYVPCHRVVDRNGRLAPNFAFDGSDEQGRRLIAEGVKFIDNMHVDLRRCLWPL